jgi:hypothetical protein
MESYGPSLDILALQDFLSEHTEDKDDHVFGSALGPA